MMINTMSNAATTNAGGLISSDAEKLQMQEMVQDFLNHQDSQK
jgi:Holliday junction resolvasome RuvABC endonuclease subunit